MISPPDTARLLKESGEVLADCLIVLPRYATAGKTIGHDEELAALIERAAAVYQALKEAENHE